MFKNIFIATLFFFFFLANANALVILNPNDAAVTGFSQIVKPYVPKNENFIDLNGPSLRLFNLPSGESYGLVNQTAHFTVKAHDVGQVFGVAFDNALNPNIYVAATAAYGLAIYQEGKGRLEKGTPGAQYVRGLFGPANQGGGSTSIWRIDGTSGKVTLFANVVYNGIENTPASLGALAFDATSQQLFVANRTTGMIHRFSLDGTDQGVYDHGLSAKSDQSIPFDAATISSIKNPKFDTTNYTTWGFAPIERRVYALAVYHHRLFYSVAGSQIWSVAIKSDGSFGDFRFELDTGTPKDQEISSIAFDSQGMMYVAERGFPTGDSEFNQVSQSGKSRVLRFSPSDSATLWNTPGEEYAIGMLPGHQNTTGGVDLSCGKTVWSTSNSLTDMNFNGLQGNATDLVRPENTPPEKSWFIHYYTESPNDQSLGLVGAVAIWKQCRTREKYIPSVPEVAPPSVVCPLGLTLVDGACVPPKICPKGTLEMYGECVPHEPPCQSFCFLCPLWNEWGCFYPPFCSFEYWIDDICFLPPVCDECCLWGGNPWGFNPGCMASPFPCFFGDLFLIDTCSPWMVPPAWGWDNFCHCPDFYCGHQGCSWEDPFFFCDNLYGCNHFLLKGYCEPIWCFAALKVYVDIHINTFPSTGCPDHQKYRNGKCVPDVTCKSNEHLIHGKCVPDIQCKQNERLVQGKCISDITCKSNEHLVKGKCVPDTTCKSNEHLVHGVCVPNTKCKSNERLVNGICIPEITCDRNERLVNGECVPNCRSNEQLVHGECIPNCRSNEQLVLGKCVPNCRSNERLVHGKCVPNCGYNERLVNGICVPNCRSNERLVRGECVPNCRYNERLVHGECVPNCRSNERLVHGECVPNCRSNERLVHGKCVPICRSNERLVNGICIPTITCQRGERLVHGQCIRICGQNERFVHGRCIPICGPHEHLSHGRCVPDKICKPYEQLIHGQCVPIHVTHCREGERLVKGRCVPNSTIQCGSGERLINGHCVPITPTHCGPGEQLINGRCIPKNINLHINIPGRTQFQYR